MRLDKNQLIGGCAALIGITISKIFGQDGRIIVAVLGIIVFLVYIVYSLKSRKKNNILCICTIGIPICIMSFGIISENMLIATVAFIILFIGILVLKKMGIRYNE